MNKQATVKREEQSSVIDDYLKKVKGTHTKKSMQEVLDDLIQRTGISDHIKQTQMGSIKTAQQQVSLLNVDYIKNCIDTAIGGSKFTSYIDLLNDLQKIVSIDTDIPKELQHFKFNIFQDKELVNYVKEQLPVHNDIKYKLDRPTAPETVDPGNSSYFSFTQESKENQS